MAAIVESVEFADGTVRRLDLLVDPDVDIEYETIAGARFARLNAFLLGRSVPLLVELDRITVTL